VLLLCSCPVLAALYLLLIVLYALGCWVVLKFRSVVLAMYIFGMTACLQNS
jgi:hypothetical protein